MPAQVDVAKRASLRYVHDGQPGITRHKSGNGFFYRDANGKRVTDASTLERIRAIVIPPAWTDVWISPSPVGHVQATGRDAKHRKQYRYHERWNAVRDEDKYGRLAAFGRTLPRLRAAVKADMERPKLPREKVLGVVVRLLETTYIRVGNEEYARENGSFGLTTLRNRHLKTDGAELRFAFTGKSGKSHIIRLADRRLARTVKRIRDLPGQLLFQYVDDDGQIGAIDSNDVNDYIREKTGDPFTAKDFRTWAGTLLAANALSNSDDDDVVRASLTAAVKAVAEQLGNTPAVCRRRYIHPLVLRAYEDEQVRAQWMSAREHPSNARGLTKDERVLLAFLDHESAQLERAS